MKKILINMLASWLLSVKTWEKFKKTVRFLADARMSGEQKKASAIERLKAEKKRLPQNIINLGIELAVMWVKLQKGK